MAKNRGICFLVIVLLSFPLCLFQYMKCVCSLGYISMNKTYYVCQYIAVQTFQSSKTQFFGICFKDSNLPFAVAYKRAMVTKIVKNWFWDENSIFWWISSTLYFVSQMIESNDLHTICYDYNEPFMKKKLYFKKLFWPRWITCPLFQK